jgi:tetratricopeptide (TPR) repeat protein
LFILFCVKFLAIDREIGDRRGEGNALGNLGNAYACLGDASKAIEYHKQALAIDREIGDRRGEGADLGNLGNAYAALGDAHKAIEYHEQALPIFREIGDRRGEGNALDNLGNAYAAFGDARRAIEYYEQALPIFREIGDRRGEGNALDNLGNAYAAFGDAHRAIEYYEQALPIFREIGDKRGEGANPDWLGLAIAAPFIAKGAEVFSNIVGETLSEAVGDLCRSVVDRLKGDSSAEKALAEAQAKPDSKIKQTALQAAIAGKMEEDADFAEQIEKLVKTIQKESAGSAFNQRGQTVNGPQTNIAGSVQGSVFSGEFKGPVSTGGDAIDFRGSKGAIFKPTGSVSQHFGDRIEVHGDGNVFGSGSASSFKGTDMRKFQADLQSLRKALSGSGLDDETREAVDADLQTVQTQAEKPRPNKVMLLSKIRSAADILSAADGSAGAVERMQSLASGLLSLAGQLFS